MALLLISGRPGAGKSEFGQWLAACRGYVHVEVDAEGARWGSLLTDTTVEGAVDLYNQVRNLGTDVVFEWGFPVHLIGRIHQLRSIGFDAWWFDGDGDALKLSYIRRRGSDPVVMDPYERQVSDIQAAWARIKRLYGDHIVSTVGAGPSYMPLEDVAAIVVQD